MIHYRVTVLAAALFTLAQAGRLHAQEHEHQHAVGQLGRVVFPVSCTAKARQGFEHAMAVLHSFWWEEGERAFGAVLAADSTCAMAYWGLALNAWAIRSLAARQAPRWPRAWLRPSGARRRPRRPQGARIHRRHDRAVP